VTARWFKKKPVAIQAMQLSRTNSRTVETWCGGSFVVESKTSDPTDVAVWLNIPTLEGVMRANIGDWIIRGVKGEFYPCKPDIFEATYESMEQPS